MEYWRQGSRDELNCSTAENDDWIPTRNHHSQQEEYDEIRSSEAKERDFWVLWDVVQMDYEVKLLVVGVASPRVPWVMKVVRW